MRPFCILEAARGALRAAAVVAAVALSAATAGCGGGSDIVPLGGTVTLDGQPIEGAAVMLMPRGEGKPAHAVTDAAGNFTLTTVDPGDGATPGSHTVIVTLMKVTGLGVDEEGLEAPAADGVIEEVWIVPQRYSRPDSSGLTAEVKSGMEPLVLELTSAGEGGGGRE